MKIVKETERHYDYESVSPSTICLPTIHPSFSFHQRCFFFSLFQITSLVFYCENLPWNRGLLKMFFSKRCKKHFIFCLLRLQQNYAQTLFFLHLIEWWVRSIVNSLPTSISDISWSQVSFLEIMFKIRRKIFQSIENGGYLLWLLSWNNNIQMVLLMGPKK